LEPGWKWLHPGKNSVATAPSDAAGTLLSLTADLSKKRQLHHGTKPFTPRLE
jgi:hypothetical protein